MGTPALHIFNPWHDMALANYRPNYQPPFSALQMARDLAMLPRWIAREGDILLDADLTPVPFSLESSSPVCRDGKGRVILPEQDYTVRPWGWDLLIHRMLQKKYPWLQLPSREKIDRLRELSSRGTSVEILGMLHKLRPDAFVGESFLCSTVEQVEACCGRYPHTLLKQLYSSSGKGLKPICGLPDEPARNWCRRSIEMQGGVVVEPRYDRVQDFALEFVSEQGQIRFCGYSVFLTTDTGMYVGNLLDTQDNLEEYLLHLLEPSCKDILRDLKGLLVNLLTQQIAPAYEGPFGVDMMLVRTADGSLRIHPCVEINMRFNMGQLATHLSQRLLRPGEKGVFRIAYFRSPEELQKFHTEFEKSKPGYFPLTPVTSETQYLAYAVSIETTSVEEIKTL